MHIAMVLALTLTIGCIVLILVWQGRGVPRPDDVRGRTRDRSWGLLLLPIAMAAAVMAGGAHGLIPAELGLAVLAIVFAPTLAARLVPFGVLGLAVYGVHLARKYQDGFSSPVQYVFVHAGAGAGSSGLLAEAGVLFVVGLSLLLRLDAELVAALTGRWLDRGRGGISAAHGLLLVPVAVLVFQLLGPGNWFGWQAVDGLDVALIEVVVATATLVLIFRSRAWATTLAAAGLLVFGAYGWLIALFGSAMPGFAYGFSDLHNSPAPAPLWSDALQGSVLLAVGLWLAPRVMRHHLAGTLSPPDLELAARARQLTQRVQTLTQTRRDAVDGAAAELRRIERDLHDGAQARLVALGMSLQAAERLFPTNPDAALALVAEAKESSSRALTELRDLVRGIYPPVLADRGLPDAIRALALDAPLPVEVDIDLPGPAATGGQGSRAATGGQGSRAATGGQGSRAATGGQGSRAATGGQASRAATGGQVSSVELPVASAVYFSVAEALTNVTKHAHARSARIQLSSVNNGASGLLRVQVTDDGCGGADPAQGTGLAGVERRLAAFDGILAVSSPPGGPTIVVIEVPCALSSPKTSSC